MKHQTISFIKSGIRIAGYVVLTRAGDFIYVKDCFIIAGIVLIISELIGVVEEMGHE